MQTIAHILWIRKWWMISIWLLLAIPSGVILSFFDLPVSYQAKTIMRFPSVEGAQTNMMRDVAITQKESIISTITSYQVMVGVIERLGLRIRLQTPEKFRKDYFRDIRTTPSLGEGIYSLDIQRGGKAEVYFKPKGAASKYNLHSGVVDSYGYLRFSGMEMRFTEEAMHEKFPVQLEFKYSGLEETVRAMLKRVKVGTLGRVIFEVSYKDRDPYLVSEILNTLREEFLGVYYGTTEVQDVGVLVQMERDLQLSNERLQKSQDALSNFYMMHPELNDTKVETDTREPLGLLQAETRSEALRTLKAKINGLQQARPLSTEGTEVLYWAQEILGAAAEGGSARANILRAKLFSLNQTLIEKKSQFNPGHPQIVAAKNSLDSMFAEIDAECISSLRQIDRELAQSQLVQKAFQPKQKVEPSVKIKLDLQRLVTENDNNREVYDKLLATYNRAKLTTGSEFFKVTVVDEARPAQYIPPTLQKRLMLAFVAVISLLIVIPVFFILGQVIFPSVWIQQDVKTFLGSDVAGQLQNRQIHKSKGGAEVPQPTLSWEDREAIRSVREDCIYHFATLKNEALCITVTSARPAEGKSFIARQLAESFARTGRKVLLIDADLRKGWQDRIYEVEKIPGLGDLLGSDGATFLQNPTPLFKTTQTKNLSLLTIGDTKRFFNDQWENNQAIPDLMALVKSLFQVVIIDTPPILLVPDAHAFIARSHGVLAVLRSGVTSVSEAREIKKVIDSRNRTLTIVLNGVRSSIWSRTHSSKYRSYYGT